MRRSSIKNIKSENIKIIILILIFFLAVTIFGEFNLTMFMGRILSSIFIFIFGYSRIYLYLVFLLILIRSLLTHRYLENVGKKMLLNCILIYIIIGVSTGFFVENSYFYLSFFDFLTSLLTSSHAFSPVGLINAIVFYILFWTIGYIGIFIFLLCIFLLLITNLYNINSIYYFLNLIKKLIFQFTNSIEKKYKEFISRNKSLKSKKPQYQEIKIKDNYDIPDSIPRSVKSTNIIKEDKKSNTFLNSSSLKVNSSLNYKIPSISLLNVYKKSNTHNRIDIAEKKILENTLKNFNVSAKVIEIKTGPAITRYKLRLGEGIKLNKITSLTSEISLALAAKDVRIQAPIPGEQAIGIEVPNKKRDLVSLRDVLSSDIKDTFYKLPLPLGKDISGESVIVDLVKLPHILVAGTTGSGKSVCLNSFVITLLLLYTPEELRLLMIDPKKVEFSCYNNLPHLITPVITDAKQASYMLKKIVKMMESRYAEFSKVKVKNLEMYNQYCKKNKLSIMPYAVVVIDELSDLMLVSAKSVEESVTRLTQMARAAGIHMILATQRPSVDVITGIIKSNIPARVSFSVSSQIDSRTILDMTGAEKLIGNGDMLYVSPSNSTTIRIQSPYITDEEINSIVNFIQIQDYKFKGSNDIDNDIMQQDETKEDNKLNFENKDVLYREILEFCLTQEYLSVSKIQRKFKVGYNRAARIVDLMEEDGFLGETVGTRGRIIHKKNISNLIES